VVPPGPATGRLTPVAGLLILNNVGHDWL